MDRKTRAYHLILVFVLLSMVACGDGNDDGDGDACGDTELPPLSIGPNGEKISFSQLMDNDAVLCPGLASGATCTFSVAFIVEGLKASATAQLLVEIKKDANGNDFFGPIFPQPVQVTLTPGQQGGTLSGTLGPPVSDKVRFNLAIQLKDLAGGLIASSQPVCNLRPQ